MKVVSRKSDRESLLFLIQWSVLVKMRAVSVCLFLLFTTSYATTEVRVQEAVTEANLVLEKMKIGCCNNTEDINKVVSVLSLLNKEFSKCARFRAAVTQQENREFWVDVTTKREFQFNGSSYLAISSTASMDKMSFIDMSFKTNAEDGLMFVALGRDRITLEMKGGHVLFQYTIRGVNVSLQSDDGGYSDGRWHAVSGRRQGERGTLFVDNVQQKMAHEGFKHAKLQVTSVFYYGGLPDEDKLVVNGFNGSLREVKVRSEVYNDNDIDLSHIVSCRSVQSQIISSGSCKECGNECVKPIN